MDLRNEIVRALWWKQPFASAMLVGKIETRTWKTNVRGKVLICSSMSPYKPDAVDEICGMYMQKMFNDISYGRNAYSLMRKPVVHATIKLNGYAIAIGDLIDCRPMTPEDQEGCYVEFRNGLFCHVYDNVRAIEPIQMKGQQGWRIMSEEVKSKIKLL